MSSCSPSENTFLMADARRELADFFELMEANSNSNNHSLQSRYAGEHAPLKVKLIKP